MTSPAKSSIPGFSGLANLRQSKDDLRKASSRRVIPQTLIHSNSEPANHDHLQVGLRDSGTQLNLDLPIDLHLENRFTTVGSISIQPF